MGGGTMIIKLQGYADDVIALALEQCGNDGGIDTPGHGHNHARVGRLASKAKRVDLVPVQGRRGNGSDLVHEALLEAVRKTPNGG
jgi:hypothetical protein